ncbi:hypothetical protein BJX70DRAFT_374968 [Aspergillus crustosus]
MIMDDAHGFTYLSPLTSYILRLTSFLYFLFVYFACSACYDPIRSDPTCSLPNTCI